MNTLPRQRIRSYFYNITFGGTYPFHLMQMKITQHCSLTYCRRWIFKASVIGCLTDSWLKPHGASVMQQDDFRSTCREKNIFINLKLFSVLVGVTCDDRGISLFMLGFINSLSIYLYLQTNAKLANTWMDSGLLFLCVVDMLTVISSSETGARVQRHSEVTLSLIGQINTSSKHTHTLRESQM